MNSEVAALFQADRQERIDQPAHGTTAYRAMRERDRQRRERIAALVAAGALEIAEDYYQAAWIFQHGDVPDDAWHAYSLALKAAELGYQPARWLTAAAFDRWLMSQGRPQKYGTQYVSDGERQRLWDVDPATTDEDRARWDVPPLEEQLRKADEATRNHPPTPIGDDAPGWLRDALKRWQAK